MIAAVGSRLVILLFGTLYPAYASYKAVRNKDVKAYVQWMMYWIVFALFTCAETFSDVFLSFWVPFYYELKVVIVLWLLSPATKGSSLLYRKFVHPTLTEREKEIDEYLAKMRERSYSTMLELGTKGINYALQTAIKGGGGLVNQLRKSYSLSDLSDKTDGSGTGEMMPRQRGPPTRHPTLEDSDDADDLGGVAHRGYSPRRSASGSGRMEMYFPAVDVDVARQPPAGRSVTALSNEISENGDAGDSGMEVDGEPLVRTSSLSSTRSGRLRRPVNPALATTPSGRKSVVASVPEGTEAVTTTIPPPSPPNIIDSTLVSESIVSENDTFIEPEVKLADVLDVNLVSEKLENFKNTLVEMVVPEIINPIGECIEHFEEIEEKDNKLVEPTESKNDDNSEFKDSLDKNVDKESCDEKVDFVQALDQNIDQVIESSNEKVDFVQALDLNTDNVEFVEALDEKIAQNIPETKTVENSPVKEIPKDKSFDDNKWNKVTVEVESPNPGSMLVRLSMESLPTSSKSADAMQQQLENSNIPVVVEKFEMDSLRASNDSLASCSLPSSPTVSRSNSRLSDGRAGKYNKLPAPIRPESPPAEESPMKARLVLKPGVLRQLPETLGESSEVFLPTNAKDKKRKKQRSNLTSLFPFWQGGSNPKTGEDKDSEGSKTNATNL